MGETYRIRQGIFKWNGERRGEGEIIEMEPSIAAPHLASGHLELVRVEGGLVNAPKAKQWQKKEELEKPEDILSLPAELFANYGKKSLMEAVHKVYAVPIGQAKIMTREKLVEFIVAKRGF